MSVPATPPNALTPACGTRGCAKPIIDGFGRTFTYLRVSVTDHCNLRCVYCMPAEGVAWLPQHEILSFEEIHAVVAAAAEHGAFKVRLTGGEPLVRKDIDVLTGMIARVPGVTDLALTTNGILLERYAEPLAKAGLKRINISLDTLNPEKFVSIARHGRLEQVLAGIQAATAAGLSPLKINMVVLGGLNDTEVAEFARLSLNQKIEIRFIEYMPLEEAKGCAMGSGNFSFIPNTVTRERIERVFGTLEPLETGEGMRGPAEVWTIKGAAGRLWIISAMSAPFCKKCDRLRLTAVGELRSCLLDGGGVDLRKILRGGHKFDEMRARLTAAFIQAAWKKPEIHKNWADIPAANMSRIGG